jgi:hypothetical protein
MANIRLSYLPKETRICDRVTRVLYLSTAGPRKTPRHLQTCQYDAVGDVIAWSLALRHHGRLATRRMTCSRHGLVNLGDRLSLGQRQANMVPR